MKECRVFELTFQQKLWVCVCEEAGPRWHAQRAALHTSAYVSMRQHTSAYVLPVTCSTRRLVSTAKRILTYTDVCWRMLTHADVCWRMLTEASWRVHAGRDGLRLRLRSCLHLNISQHFEYVKTCHCMSFQAWHMLTYADVCWRMLTYADVCWRMLTYACKACHSMSFQAFPPQCCLPVNVSIRQHTSAYVSIRQHTSTCHSMSFPGHSSPVLLECIYILYIYNIHNICIYI
jgi:hypothetical protein